VLEPASLTVIQQGPLIAGEIGENDCAHTYIDPLMNWLDSIHKLSGLDLDAWGAALCGQGPVLIMTLRRFRCYGQGYKIYLALLSRLDADTNQYLDSGRTNRYPNSHFHPPLPRATFTPVAPAAEDAGPSQRRDTTQETELLHQAMNTSSSAVTGVFVSAVFHRRLRFGRRMYVFDVTRIRQRRIESGIRHHRPDSASGSTYYYTFTLADIAACWWRMGMSGAFA